MTTETDDRELESDSNSDFPVPYDQAGVVERFRDAIRAAGGNIAVARASGVPKGTINNLLSGTDISLSRAFTLAATCRVSLDWLATGVGGKAPNWLGLHEGASKQLDTDQQDSTCPPCTEAMETEPGAGATVQGPQERTRPAGLQESSAMMRTPIRVESDILAQAIEIVCAVLGQDIVKDPPPKLAERIVNTYEVLTGVRS